MTPTHSKQEEWNLSYLLLFPGQMVPWRQNRKSSKKGVSYGFYLLLSPFEQLQTVDAQNRGCSQMGHNILHQASHYRLGITMLLCPNVLQTLCFDGNLR